MKKGLVISVMLVSLLLVGCGKSQKKYESALDENAKNYYETFMKKYAKGSVDKVEITLKELKQANSVGSANYDLSALEKCTDSSTVIYTLDKESGDIKGTQYKLNCD